MNLSQQTLTELEKTISTERLNYFQSAISNPILNPWKSRAGITNSDRKSAVKLHLWNDALSMAFMPSLRIFELTLRNRIHEELERNLHRSDWWSHPRAYLSAFQNRSIQSAIDSINDKNQTLTVGRIISELNFGFWESFTSKHMDNPRNKPYWRDCIHKVFNEKDRSKVSRTRVNSELKDIRKIRNRIAHHEPIILLNLGNYYSNISSLLKEMCDHTNDFMEETSLVPNILAEDWIGAIVTSRKLVGSKF